MAGGGKFASSKATGTGLGDINTFLGFTASPDRDRFLYLRQDNTGRDLMLVENFR